MPVSVKIDPFSQQPILRYDLSLRVPQARVLAALMPQYPEDPPHEWPVWNRAMLAVHAGYTAVSGSVTRVLNGIRAGSSSGDAHPGLLARGFIEEFPLDIEGTVEMNYRITTDGIKAFQAFVAKHGALPPLKDTAACANLYQGKGENHRSKRRQA